MKSLSIQQPWAWAILHAGKDIENRSWPWPERIPLPCRIVIHAGKQEDPEGLLFLAQKGIHPPANLPTGCLLGESTVVKCFKIPGYPFVPEAFSPWAFGPYCWVLDNPVAYPEPIPYRGQLGVFDCTFCIPKKGGD